MTLRLFATDAVIKYLSIQYCFIAGRTRICDNCDCLLHHTFESLYSGFERMESLLS
jgi:hypothetical protein